MKKNSRMRIKPNGLTLFVILALLLVGILSPLKGIVNAQYLAEGAAESQVSTSAFGAETLPLSSESYSNNLTEQTISSTAVSSSEATTELTLQTTAAELSSSLADTSSVESNQSYTPPVAPAFAPLVAAAASDRLSYEVSVVEDSSFNNGIKYTLTNANVSASSVGYGSLNFVIPEEYEAHYTTPANWNIFIGGNIVNFIINTPATNGTPAAIINFLENNLYFTLKSQDGFPVAASKITVNISENPMSSRIDENGQVHYYEFVRMDSVKWLDAYNSAKTRTYNGLTGYLATITSQEEQNFVYNSIAKMPGWLGASRMRHAVTTARINDESSISTNMTDFDYSITVANDWYWTNGPESGTVFLNGASGNNYVSGQFNYWATTQPDNAKVFGGDGEYVMMFAYSGSQWNDTVNTALGTCKGYYIEYGGYPGEEPEEETVGYQASVPAPVKVQYTGTNALGETIVFDEGILTGNATAAYSTTENSYTDYELLRIDGNAEGTFTYNPQTVTYVYQLKSGAAITVNYLDEDGTAITPAVTLQGQVTTAYAAEEKTFTDYELVSIDGSATGTFTYSPQTVTYVYTLKAGADITVNYITEEGASLDSAVVLQGKVTTGYLTKQKDFENYELLRIEGSVSGIFTYEPQTVTYVYTLKEGGTVTIAYIDEEGNHIAEDTALSGKVTTPFSSVAKTINGYTLQQIVNSEPMRLSAAAAGVEDTITGVFSLTPQKYICLYTKNQEPAKYGTVIARFLDENGKEIAPDASLSGLVGEVYQTSPITLNGYSLQRVEGLEKGVFTESEQVVIYHYHTSDVKPSHLGGDIIVRYLDQGGKALTAEIVIKGKEVGESYQTEKKSFTGYNFVKVEGAATGSFIDNEQIVTYYYQKTGSDIAKTGERENFSALMGLFIFGGAFVATMSLIRRRKFTQE